ncbi:hypothetical protein ACJMK2_019536 [Sinanodonta woodiana]|uniref:GOLD domain-containing protein n=1 Tax=Sinanodonta woodiana TaxID=1069815 RepID=A0ABD3TWC6_SINWO
MRPILQVSSVIYVFLLFFVLHISALETDLTVDVGAGRQECFYQPFKSETELEVEYQVIDGGDLDISFYVQAPDGTVLVAENKKSENVHRIQVKLLGDYKICLDNTFSHFSSKLVFLELLTDEDEDDEEDDDGEWAGAKEELGDLVDMKVEDFQKIINNMKANLDKTMQLQNALKMFEARDRNIQEGNFEYVNWFSGIQVFVMISVALVQVILIRQLFNDKANVSRTMKTRT